MPGDLETYGCSCYSLVVYIFTKVICVLPCTTYFCPFFQLDFILSLCFPIMLYHAREGSRDCTHRFLLPCSYCNIAVHQYAQCMVVYTVLEVLFPIIYARILHEVASDYAEGMAVIQAYILIQWQLARPFDSRQDFVAIFWILWLLWLLHSILPHKGFEHTYTGVCWDVV